jgi:hypothetical protein
VLMHEIKDDAMEFPRLILLYKRSVLNTVD